MSGPRFAHLLINTDSEGVDHRKVAEAARAQIRTLDREHSVCPTVEGLPLD
jgi:hypothetical protein